MPSILTFRLLEKVKCEWARKLLERHSDQGERIDSTFEDPERPMQMGTGRAARRPDVSDRGALFDQGSSFDQKLRQVAVNAENALAMIDDHGLAGKIQLAGENHLSRVGRQNLRPPWRGDVDAGMDGRRSFVVDPALPKIGKSLLQERRHEAPRPQPVGSDLAVDILENHLFSLDPL